MLCFFAAVLSKKITAQALVFQLQSRGLELHLRSSIAERVVQEHRRRCCLCLQGHRWWRARAPLTKSFVPFPDSSSSPLSCMVWAGSDQHILIWCAANFLFAIIFPRLKIPISHFLSMDNDAAKSGILFRTFCCLAQLPINAANTIVTDSIWWPFVLSFQPLEN